MAMDFESSTGQSISLGDVLAQQNIFAGGGTVMAWIKVESFGEGGFGRILDVSTDMNGSNGFSLQVSSPNEISFLKGFSTVNGFWDTNTGPISTGIWYHIAAVYNSDMTGNDAVIYVNGVSQSITESSTPNGTAESDVGQDKIIGERSDGSRSFDGIIDDLRLYDRPLSTDEIVAIYGARGHDGIVLGLVGRYLMNENPAGQESIVNTHYIDSTQAINTSGTSVTINVPTVSDGDLMVAMITPSGNSSGTPADVTTPAGWTLMATGDLPATASTPSLWVYRRTASSEPATYNFAIDQTNTILATMVTYDGNFIATTEDVISSINTGFGNTATAPTISPSANAMILRICSLDAQQLPNDTPSFFPKDTVGREALEAAGVGNGCATGFSEHLAPSGPTGTAIFTMFGNDQSGCFTVAFLGGNGTADSKPIKDLSGTQNNGIPRQSPIYATGELAFRKRV